MKRLLSDVDGKIRHVLLCLAGPRDVRRVAFIVHELDKEVEITIACHQDVGLQIPTRARAVAKKVLRRNLSVRENLALNLPRGRRVNLLPMANEPWMWAQDLIHISEDKTVSPSISEREDVLSDVGKMSKQTSSELIKQRFWKEREFNVRDEQRTGLSNSDGGDMIVCGETVFVGDGMINNYLKNKLGIKGNYVKPETYKRAQSSVLRGLRTLEKERMFRLLPFQLDHLDMIFTPIAENCFVVADMKQVIESLNLPADISIDPRYEKYISLLENLADFVSSEHRGRRVVRIPCIPPLVYDGHVLNHFTSYNNILQERIKLANGTITHRAYVPIYSHSPTFLQRINPAIWFGFARSAIDIYRDLGLKVRTVPFLLERERYIGGGLRCSVKVLERVQ